MKSKSNHWDYIVIGGGIVGLTIAAEIRKKFSTKSILILEKEDKIGLHGSGRNSGVLHSGIYYKSNSLKAKLCGKGMRLMKEYCYKNKLPINQIGKIIVPSTFEEDVTLGELYARSKANKINAEIIDKNKLRKMDASVFSYSGRALLLPETSVIDPNSVLQSLIKDLKFYNVVIKKNEQVVSANSYKNEISTNKSKYSYSTLVNASGQYSDKVAHLFGAGSDYTVIPFKGSYHILDPKSPVKPTHLIYPVPDLKLPFLGVHSVTTIDGSIYFGPTAIPALGRENYHGMKDIDYKEVLSIITPIIQKFKSDSEFRKHSYSELKLLRKEGFVQSVNKIFPKIQHKYLNKSNKVGIRPQLYNKKLKTLEMDFIIERKDRSFHILNSISPAFTSSFAIAQEVVNCFDQ